MSFFSFLCCCCSSQSISPTPMDNGHRLKSSVPLSSVQIIPDVIRKTTQIVAYSCPICFLYYTKIMYCDKCANCMCIFCLKSIVQKSNSLNQVMYCPFCKSEDSEFKDWEEQEGKVYFDKSIGGPFMTTAMRNAENSPNKKEKLGEENQEVKENNNQAEESQIHMNQTAAENVDHIREQD